MFECAIWWNDIELISNPLAIFFTFPCFKLLSPLNPFSYPAFLQIHEAFAFENPLTTSLHCNTFEIMLRVALIQQNAPKLLRCENFVVVTQNPRLFMDSHLEGGSE